MKEEYRGLSVITQGLKADIADLGSLSYKEIIYHHEFMCDEMLATVFMEYQRLVRKQLPTRGLDSDVMKMMSYVHSVMGSYVSLVCSSYYLMKQWCQSHFQVDGTRLDIGLGALTSKQKKIFKKLKKKMKKDQQMHLLKVDSMKSNLAEALVLMSITIPKPILLNPRLIWWLSVCLIITLWQPILIHGKTQSFCCLTCSLSSRT